MRVVVLVVSCIVLCGEGLRKGGVKGERGNIQLPGTVTQLGTSLTDMNMADLENEAKGNQLAMLISLVEVLVVVIALYRTLEN